MRSMTLLEDGSKGKFFYLRTFGRKKNTQKKENGDCGSI